MDFCNQVKVDLAETGIVVDVGTNPVLTMPVVVSGDQRTVYINGIPVVTPVDNVETADSGGGEQVNLRVLDNTQTLAATKCETTYYNFKVEF
jgi:hypothetical protein